IVFKEFIKIETEWNSLFERLADENVFGWLFDKENNDGSIIVASGNAMGLGRAYDYNKYLFKTNHRILLISYQGYGKNEGTASLDSLISDIRSFYRFMKDAYKDEPIYFVGISIGAPAGICSVSDEIKFNKIVLESAVNPKTVALTKARQWWPLFPVGYPLALAVSSSVPDELDISDCISKFNNIPILFIHHKKDKLAPYGPAKDLYSIYKGPKLFWEPSTSTSTNYHLNVKHNIKMQNEILIFLTNHK
ncbi:MAG: alpha/beta fold hydrolase, partial [Nitrospirota bacterium]